MKHFELRFLDSLDRIAITRPWVGQDTLAALAEAERLSDRHTTIEVWHRARKVALIRNRHLFLDTQGPL